MTQAIHTATQLKYPNSIGASRIAYLVHVKGIDPIIAELDLEMLKLKMQDQTEGKGWTEEQCDSGEIEYKRYLTLCKVYGKGMVPNVIMDDVWHYHILDTISYHKDCESVFGFYMHHYPYFGMRGDQDEKDLETSFHKTARLYKEQFGEEIARDEHQSCWHDCQNRCWHACPSMQ